jgi:hypothetical protein
MTVRPFSRGTRRFSCSILATIVGLILFYAFFFNVIYCTGQDNILDEAIKAVANITPQQRIVHYTQLAAASASLGFATGKIFKANPR